MGFNAGGFAGALGQAALGTYERLNEQAFRNLQREKLQQEMADQAALKQYLSDAAQQKNYTGGTDVSTAINQGTSIYDPETAKTVQGIIANQTPEQQQTALRGLGSAEGAVTPKTQEGALDLKNVGVYKDDSGNIKASTEGTALSQAEQYKYALKQAQAAGNTNAIKELLPLKNAMRESEQADKWDEFRNKGLGELERIADSGNTEGFIKKAKSHGLDIRVKQLKDGGQEIQHWEGGKLVKGYSSLKSAAQAAAPALLSKLGIEHFGSVEKYIAYQQGERQIGLKEREVAAKEALVPSEIVKNQGQAAWYGTKQDAGSWKQTTINETDPATGVITKTPVFTKLGTRDGKPYVEAYRADGTPVTDKGAIKQIAEGGVPQSDDGGAPAAMGRDMALVAERYQKGLIDYETYRIEQQKIAQHYKQTATDKNLGKAGGKDPYATPVTPTPVPAPAASKTSAKEAIPLSSEIEVVRSKGGTIYKVPGVNQPFSSREEAQKAYDIARAAAEKNKFRTTLSPADLQLGINPTR